MKSLCWFLPWLFLSPAGFASTEMGNGGDALLQEFNLRGLQLAAYLRSEAKAGREYGIDPAQFQAVVRQTRLTAEDRLFLHGEEVDAINYPTEKRIEVSRTRWQETSDRLDAYFLQRRIALHEYLWIYGVDDDGYTISNPIIQAMEQSAGTLLDPEVRRLLFLRFCNYLSNANFPEARRLLNWGLELNTKCQIGMTPIEIVLLSTPDRAELTAESEQLELLRAMFIYGLNPNVFLFQSLPLIVEASLKADLRFLQMTFEFGADPNFLDKNGVSAFSQVTNATGPSGPVLTVPVLHLFLENGGDVNLSDSSVFVRSPARSIISQPRRSDLVEALIDSGKVNWCLQMDLFGRNYDRVLDEYLPLLQKYEIHCGPYQLVSGEASSCAEAQSLGRKKCQDAGFIFSDPALPDAENCMEIRTESSLLFRAYYHCHNGY